MSRIILFILVVALLIAGWNRPLKEQFTPVLKQFNGYNSPASAVQSEPAQSQMPQQEAAPEPVSRAVQISTPRPAATPDRSWMFKKGNMDIPHK